MSEQHDDRDLAETEELDADQLSPDEEEEAAEHEQAEAPAPAPPDSEATIKKAEAANRAYLKKLTAIFGEKSGHRECPACQGLGITWAQDVEGPDLQQAEDAEPCPDCNAYGLTITGSKNPDQATKPCNGCGGRGWRNKLVAVTTPTPIVQPTPDTTAPVGGQWVHGKGFIPYGATEPMAGTNLGAV